MIRKIGVFHLFTVSGAATFIQDAAVTALSDENVDKYNNYMIETYRERKDYMVPRLRELGFEIPEIDGAFYIFAKIPAKYQHLGAMEFCKLLAKEARVGVIPGTAFGKAYDNYFRISYATSIENIKEAVERISQFINKQKGYFMRGKFITVEGSDGSGKTTFINFLTQYLKDKGYKVITTREPGGTEFSEKVRELLFDKTYEIDAKTESYYFV